MIVQMRTQYQSGFCGTYVHIAETEIQFPDAHLCRRSLKETQAKYKESKLSET